MTDVPVWLLDIDGVINAPLRPRQKPPTYAWPLSSWIDTHARTMDGERFRICAARPVVQFITEVHEQGRAEIRWHTTWQEAANNLGIGLPQFPVQEAPEYYAMGESLSKGEWWKLPAVWRVMAEGRRVLWTDDDIDYELMDGQRSSLFAAGCRMISPNQYIGLTLKNLRKIEEHLA